MTDDDKVIREMAREECAKRCDNAKSPLAASLFRCGSYDYSNDMRLAEAAIRAGIKLGRSL